MSCCDPNVPACPCGTFVHPSVIVNPPGLTNVAARSGDYVSYRHALLQALPGETELSRSDGTQITLLWRPSAQGDLALQLAEWWAYLADILTFYNERVTNESYLRTAMLPESVNRLIGLLGYRPRPALGAKGTLAALVNRARPVVIPQGMQIQSKPGPGQLPQIFEVDTATTVSQPDALPALPAALPPASFFSTTSGAVGQPSQGSTATLLVAGKLGTVTTGDELLLVATGWDGTSQKYAVGTVTTLTDQTAPGGAHNTQVQFTVASQTTDDFSATGAANWRLLASSGAAKLYPYLNPSNRALAPGSPPKSQVAHLASLFRQINPGDLILVDAPAASAANPPYLGFVSSYSEAIYFANNPDHPCTVPPQTSPNADIPAVPVLHSVIQFLTPGATGGDPATVVVRYGWKSVGQLIDPPATTVPSGSSGAIQSNLPSSANATTTSAAGTGPAGATGTPVLVADVNGDGATGTIDASGNVTLASPAPSLVPPLTTLFNLVGVSRGKSVTSEVLGSGDGNVLNQDFQLKNVPVTYFADGAGLSGTGFSSTVQVWVNNVQWAEVPSFFGQAPNAQVFRTREDESGSTHVVFGDGLSGARLPTGSNNIVANYRYGAGAAVPEAGTLVSVLQAQPGLASLVNPVAPAGGTDADPPAKVRTLAPESVLTFGRAVSLDDYQTLAAGAPGVTAAQASYAFDPLAQRPTVHVWVAGDAGAAPSAQAAIATVADPNRTFKVEAATAIDFWLSLTYVRDPRYLDADVQQGIHDALLDPDRGLFGSNRVRIGQAYFDSDIYAACLAVQGVVAVHQLSFVTAGLTLLTLPVLRLTGRRLEELALQRRIPTIARDQPLKLVARPPIDLLPIPINISSASRPCNLERYSPGDGNYFALLDDGEHLTITGEVSS